MSRTVFTIFFSCFFGPLVAWSYGGTLSYAPIVMSPPRAVFDKTAKIVETTETIEAIVLKKPVVPAIPKSIRPADFDSFAEEPLKMETRKPQPTLMHLPFYDLPVLKTAEQPQTFPQEPPAPTSETQTFKPPVASEEEAGEREGTDPGEICPPVAVINKDGEQEGVDRVRGQTSSRGGTSVIQGKPGQPEGSTRVSLPDELTREPSEPAETTGDSMEPSGRGDSGQEGEGILPTDVSESGNRVAGQGVSDTQWTITALVMLAALSTFSFLCTVFVVGEYRRRWLNAIMSQNGMPGFRGGLYDIPGVSIGYGRYED